MVLCTLRDETVTVNTSSKPVNSQRPSGEDGTYLTEGELAELKSTTFQ